MSNLTDGGILLRLVYQAMQALSVDSGEVLRRCGIRMADLDDQSLRTPHGAQNLFWQVIEEVSGDPFIGLHLGEKLPVFRGQVLEYLFLSSPTFGEGLSRAMNYQRLISDAFFGRLVQDDSGTYLNTRFPISEFTPSQARHFAECLVAGLIIFFRHITDGAFKPTKIWFVHDELAPAAEYQRVYGCEASGGQSEYRLYFDPVVLDRPSLHYEPELLRLHEQVASNKVAELEKRDLLADVKRVIGEHLESGEVTLEMVADRLHLKPRTLRLRLSEAGTSFNQVLADYRCRLARRLLARTDEPIEQIVYLTGFSEPSTFYRAFKRWMDETPAEYRKRKWGDRQAVRSGAN